MKCYLNFSHGRNDSINEDQLYRVCIRSFKNKFHTVKLKIEDISKGFKNAFII